MRPRDESAILLDARFAGNSKVFREFAGARVQTIGMGRACAPPSTLVGSVLLISPIRLRPPGRREKEGASRTIPWRAPTALARMGTPTFPSVQ
jgi:hypothetical protein